MTQTAEASPRPRPLTDSARAFVAGHGLWIGVGAIAVAAAAFLLHQLMAWAPHEDETLALFVGRDSLAGVVEHVTRERGGAPLHFLFAYAVAHLGLGLGSLRLVSAAFAVGSLPLVALLGRRLVDRRTALIATALVAGSWVFLFHGVYGRMYSLFLFLSLLAFLSPPPRPRPRHAGGRGLCGVAAILLAVAAHPYGALVLAAQGVFVLVARRDRLRQAAIAFAVGARRRHAVLAHRPRPRRPVRRRRRRPRGEARRPVGGRHVPLADGRGLQHRALARARRRARIRARRASSP